MPGTVQNFNRQLATATDIAMDDEIVIFDTSAGVTKTVTPLVAGFGGGVVVIGDVTTYAVTAANNGKVHIIGALTADVLITLPTSASGLNYEFWFCSTAAEAQNAKIETGSATNCFSGGVVHLDDVSGTGADEVIPVYSNGSSNDTLTLVTPSAGTRVRVVSAGTVWHISGTVVSDTAPTLADT